MDPPVGGTDSTTEGGVDVRRATARRSSRDRPNWTDDHYAVGSSILTLRSDATAHVSSVGATAHASNVDAQHSVPRVGAARAVGAAMSVSTIVISQFARSRQSAVAGYKAVQRPPVYWKKESV
ncbi:hypothetical protein [Natronoarchaeum rubrum]|uniref:hypothetical protein n=1 Tax=Natronoarchaeum rubrum TaxID=755311 RepID=UPI0021137983|nr:hypothetical protein [Natronoarchaeum rubrum]